MTVEEALPLALQPIQETLALRRERLHLYAIVDSAQDASLAKLLFPHGSHRCLFSYDDEAPVTKLAPHLIALDTLFDDGADSGFAARAIARRTHVPCITLLATPLDFEGLFAHLEKFLEVRLQDGAEMFLAWWDPMVLAALVGHAEDHTLHVPGPIFTAEQRTAFVAPIVHWWYWDRESNLQCIAPEPSSAGTNVEIALPIKLEEAQIDQIVELSVPDQILHYLDLNQAHLLSRITAEHRYTFVRESIAKARSYKLEGTGDILNYTCATIIYGERMDTDPQIQALLGEVKLGKQSFESALKAFPE